MAVGSVRAAFKDRVVSLVKAQEAVNGVQVEHGYPGDRTERDVVYTATCTGHVDITLMQGGRKTRNDTFDLVIVIVTGKHGLDPVESEARVTTYLSAVEDVFANDLTLGGLDGLIDCQISSIEGPNTTMSGEGAVSYFYVTVTAHARYF